MDIKKNILEFLSTLQDKNCTLVAVSKTKPPEDIMEAYNAGQKIFGENKVQELTDKFEKLPKDIEWHMIGHLQRNKVKYIAEFVSLIHSVDSPRLLRAIDKEGKKVNRKVPCLIQMHIAEEDSKYGFDEEELMQLFQENVFDSLNHVDIRGLMGMATFTDNIDQVRREFRGLAELFRRLKERELPENVSMDILSMGMSGDYEVALEEGSTMIRVGSAIFGERNIQNT
jgi:pyridoxal phosphate enzyme (YggS family)